MSGDEGMTVVGRRKGSTVGGEGIESMVMTDTEAQMAMM